MSESVGNEAAGLPPAADSQALLEFRAILENATVGILFTRNRVVVRANPLAAQMFGYTLGEFVGLSGLALYPSEEAYANVGATAGPVLAGGKPFRDEIEMLRRDGSTFWCRVSAKAVNPLRTQEGTIWIMEDVTEDLRMREALARTTGELSAILETAVLGIAVVRHRRMERCNRRFEELFGYGPGELEGQSTRLWYVSEEDFRGIGATAYPDLAAGNRHQRDQVFRRKDGSIFWGRLSGRAFAQSAPDEGSVWMLEDITEEQQAAERLSQALEEQRTIFHNAAVGIMFVREGAVRRCNHKLEEIFGYAEGELTGRSTQVFYPTYEEYLNHGRKAYEIILRGETFVGETRVRRRDGTVFWVRATGRGIGIGAGANETDVVWIFEDVTQRHEAEAALIAARDELESRVLARTAELATANSQLQEEIFERMQAEQRIWHLAHHDSLTGLPNRALLLDRLNQALAAAERYRHRVAILFVDLDRFKTINDTLGHAVGDALLVQVAERLTATVRAIDTVSRLGGDEFVLVLQEVSSSDDIVLIAEKVIGALAPAVKIDGHELRITPSVGISVYPDDGADPYALMKNADTAMYHAKAQGRNNFQFFAAHMNEEASRFFSLEHRLRAALEQESLYLQYQPLVDLDTGTVCGLEALVRWRDPDQGLVSPAEFIPIAEETGLILPIGQWVLRKALDQNRRWQEAGHPVLPISVNLSPRQFGQKGLVGMIRQALAESGQPAELLELEITESSLMQDVDTTQRRLLELSAMGVRIAIDDFGTGYSSLNYLKRFQVHKLKVDQSFVRGLGSSRDDAAIVAAILGLAKSLGVDALAEGVETREQLQLLMAAGCRKFQGYLFARPLDPDNTAELFAPGALSEEPLAGRDLRA